MMNVPVNSCWMLSMPYTVPIASRTGLMTE